MCEKQLLQTNEEQKAHNNKVFPKGNKYLLKHNAANTFFFSSRDKQKQTVK